MVIGDPIKHSLSPKMHNAGYKFLGIDDEFFFSSAKIPKDKVKDFIEAMRLVGFRGVSCTIPNKVEVMKYLDEIDEIAQKIGAVNTIVNDNGVLKGYNTDWLGIVIPLEKILGSGGIKGKNVALIGAGGASRAVAFGLKEKGAEVTIYNRTLEKAEKLAKELKVKFASLSKIENVKNADIIINSTPLGMGKYIDETPVPKEFLHKNQICFDIVYSPEETKFLTDALSKGATIIKGKEMLVYQGLEQFKLYTGKTLPFEVMMGALKTKNLTIKNNMLK